MKAETCCVPAAQIVNREDSWLTKKWLIRASSVGGKFYHILYWVTNTWLPVIRPNKASVLLFPNDSFPWKLCTFYQSFPCPHLTNPFLSLTSCLTIFIFFQASRFILQMSSQ